MLRTLELDPGNPYALSMLTHARQQRCVWSGLDALFADVDAALARAPHGDGRYTVNPFPLLGDAMRRAGPIARGATLGRDNGVAGAGTAARG